MNLLQWIVLLGGPGLLLGAGIGAIVPRWKPLIALAVLSAIAFWYGIGHYPDNPNDDDDPTILIAIAIVTNFGAWLVGLAVGAGTVRLNRHSRG